jgi:uncharacterized protein YjbI with pentapeptide repeats
MPLIDSVSSHNFDGEYDKKTRREISQTELDSIVKDHMEWLSSSHAMGIRAEAIFYSFRGLTLSGIHLDKAILRNCDFSECDLSGASLRDTSLRGSVFSNACLAGCELFGSDLSSADLTLAEDIIAPQLARTVLVGTKLPEAIAKFENLTYIDKLSEASQRLLTGLILIVAYCWLTIANTQDVAAFTTGNAAELPIIKTSVPLLVVYAGAPILLIAVYLYIHVYLQRLWEGLSALPYVFTDGVKLRQKINPWILNGFVGENLTSSTDGWRPLSRIQRIICVVLAWWLAPITIALMWIRYLRRQDLIVSACQSIALAVAIFAALYLYNLAQKTLLYGTGNSTSRRLVSSTGRAFSVFASLSALCLTLAVTISYKVIPSIEGFTVVHFEGADLSTTAEKAPEGVTKLPVEGAFLSNLNLRRLHAQAAYLANANLDDSDLTGADLSHAVLERADAVEVNLNNASLSESHLAFADFRDADLENTNLRNADLRNAILLRANLQHADLSYANLKGTKLSADLDDATLSEADLSGGGGLPYSHLIRANLSRAKLNHADLSYAIVEHGILTDADLSRADLTETDLRDAHLEWANLDHATLTRTELAGANLADAKNLTEEQINGAIINAHTTCPESVKQRCAEIVKQLSNQH